VRAILGSALGTWDNYVIGTLDCAAPAAGEVQVEVHSAGVTFVDALIASGRHQVKVALPFVPGNEVSGIVVATGAGVARLAVGDRVACVGVGGKYAELINVPAGAALRIPDRMSFDEAAVFRGGFGCAYYALHQAAGVRAGESVLVLGAAGAVGLAAVQLAAALGARVLASASSEAKRALALRAGATAAIDTNADDWRAQVRDWTDGRGLDVVVDPVGGAATERAFRALGIGGRHLVIGFASGSIPALPVNLALLKNASLIGVELSKFEQRHPELGAANDRALVALYERGAITPPPVAHRFAFERFREALTLAATGGSVGSIVLQIKEPRCNV
jgi:NADPH2:quinone reductase